jgi:hypothetical protein
MEHAIIHLDTVIDAFTLLYLSPLRYSIVYNKNIKYLFIKKIVQISPEKPGIYIH